MKLLLPLLAVLSVLAAAVSPHAHAGQPHPEDRCAACLVRGSEPVASAVHGLAPRGLPPVEVRVAPGLPPVTGAPQGAIPGQSPPAQA